MLNLQRTFMVSWVLNASEHNIYYVIQVLPWPSTKQKILAKIIILKLHQINQDITNKTKKNYS